MGSHLSIAEALAQMEAMIAHYKQQREDPVAQEAHHARQQAFHAEQQVVHEAEHRKAADRYEPFKAASADGYSSEAKTAVEAYKSIAIRLTSIDLGQALDLSHQLGIYAYETTGRATCASSTT